MINENEPYQLWETRRDWKMWIWIRGQEVNIYAVIIKKAGPESPSILYQVSTCKAFSCLHHLQLLVIPCVQI